MKPFRTSMISTITAPLLLVLGWAGTSSGQSVSLQGTTPGTQQIGSFNVNGIGLSQIRDIGGQVFNVKASYSGLPGAAGTDSGNDAPAVQRAIDAATATGGVVYFPPGIYRFQAGVTVPAGVTLGGAGWNRDTNARRGSWIHVAGSPTTFTPVRISGSGAGIAGLAFQHDQPPVVAGWAPASHPYAIVIDPSTDVHIRDVLLLNPTYGIRAGVVGGGNSGTLYIDRLFGQPLLRGIELQGFADVYHINNVHFGALWTTDENVLGYTESHAVGIASYRADHPEFQNVFMLGYQIGLLFGSGDPTGSTSRFRVTNFDCDWCWEGVRVWADGVSGHLSNVHIHNAQMPGSTGVNVTQSNNVILTLSNVHISGSGGPAVYVNGATGTKPIVLIDNIVVEGWAWDNLAWGAITGDANSEISLGFNRRFRGHGSVQYQGPVMVDQ